MTTEVLPATLEHAEALAPRLRQADKDEIRAATGDDPLGALVESVAFSPKSWAWLEDGEVVALFGVAPHPLKPSVGFPWLLGSDAMGEHKIALLRQSRRYIAEMLDACPILENYVDCRNTASIQWLAWCGFALAEVIPFYGVQRLPFIRFMAARGNQ